MFIRTKIELWRVQDDQFYQCHDNHKYFLDFFFPDNLCSRFVCSALSRKVLTHESDYLNLTTRVIKSVVINQVIVGCWCTTVDVEVSRMKEKERGECRASESNQSWLSFHYWNSKLV